MAYASLTPTDREEMLRVIGVSSIEELFADIPADLRARADTKLGAPRSEMEVRRLMAKRAAKNVNFDQAACFLGAGMYDHYIPAVVPAIVSRGEYATAYTPYQAETSQGTLQVIYEFQTLLCQLTGMEMANASLYDGATALAEALIVAMAVTKRNKFLLPRALSPFYRKVAQTYLQGLPVEIVEIETENGATSLEDLKAELDDSVAAVALQNPNFFGVLEDPRVLADLAHEKGALMISVFNPATLGELLPPGECGADIAVGEGQPLGIATSFGGPGVGLFACRKAYARHAPGRLVGQTADEQGRAGFTLTLQTREQHIRREKATSNICTNQSLCALAASVYLAAMGPRGLHEVASQSYDKAHYAARVLAEIPGCQLAFSSPFFHEFALKTPRPISEINEKLLGHNIIGGYDLGRDFPELENAMLICCTEKRTREEIDHFAAALTEIVA